MPKKKKIVSQFTEIVTHDPPRVGFSTSRWISQDQRIRTDKKHKAKPRIEEVAEELCGLCRQPTGEDQTCQKCGKLVCEKCAKTDSTGRYCPPCFDEIKSLSKLA